MVVLVDANVVLDYFLQRAPECTYANGVIKMCAQGLVSGYIAFHTLSTVWYVLRRVPDDERRSLFRALLKVLTVSGASHLAVIEAVNRSDFKDFEDCLQDMCALSVSADYIVTCNIKDFTVSKISAITPKDFCQIMQG